MCNFYDTFQPLHFYFIEVGKANKYNIKLLRTLLWSRHYATSKKIASLIPDEVIRFIFN